MSLLKLLISIIILGYNQCGVLGLEGGVLSLEFGGWSVEIRAIFGKLKINFTQH